MANGASRGIPAVLARADGGHGVHASVSAPRWFGAWIEAAIRRAVPRRHGDREPTGTAAQGHGRRQVLTYPEIVEGFRAFLERVAAVLSSEASNAGVTVPVLIAIDELDRMGSAENARTFLNEVKGIFNAKGCGFVVSIADETLQTF